MKPVCKQIQIQGFTLVELMATMVLIAIVLPVTMKAISLATQMAGHSQRQIQAAYLAKSKLSGMIVSNQWKSGARSGSFTDEWSDYEWSVKLTQGSMASMYQLDMSVFWRSDPHQKDQAVTLSTLVYNRDEYNGF